MSSEWNEDVFHALAQYVNEQVMHSVRQQMPENQHAAICNDFSEATLTNDGNVRIPLMSLNRVNSHVYDLLTTLLRGNYELESSQALHGEGLEYTLSVPLNLQERLQHKAPEARGERPGASHRRRSSISHVLSPRPGLPDAAYPAGGSGACCASFGLFEVVLMIGVFGGILLSLLLGTQSFQTAGRGAREIYGAQPGEVFGFDYEGATDSARAWLLQTLYAMAPEGPGGPNLSVVEPGEPEN